MTNPNKSLRLTCVFVAMSLPFVSASAEKMVDKYRVTKAEKAACTEDAIRLCMDAYPSEDKLIACMKENRASLSATCRVAFDAGVRRRHL